MVSNRFHTIRRVIARRSVKLNTTQLFAILFVLGLTALVSARTWRATGKPPLAEAVMAKIGTLTSTQNSAPATPALDLLDAKRYTGRASLPPNLRWNMTAFGDRLEVKGKERLNVTGTMRRNDESSDKPLSFTYEHPAQLRVELPGTSATGMGRVIAHDGRGNGRRNRDRDDDAIIETLVYDTAERFFASVAQGAALRQIGMRLPLYMDAPADEATARYDVYELIDRIPEDDGQREQRKLFYFDSDTLLLARVRYVTEQDGAQTSVEVSLSGWKRTSDNQHVPGKIVRAENGKKVLTINLDTVGISPGTAVSGTAETIP